MINETPITGRMNSEDRRGLWNQVTGYTGQQNMTKGGKFAQDMFCWPVEVGRYPNMRSCLELKHDSKLMDMNLSYWKATEAGS